MRSLVVLVVVTLATPARADNFLDIVGGIGIPLADDNWTKTADPSPKLEARAGTYHGDVGVMLQADWTAVALDQSGGSSPIGSADLTGHRFRFLLDGAFLHHVAPKVSVSARAGAGLDLAYGSYSVTILGSNTSHSNWNLGVGFEFGGGVWFDVGSLQIGAELAVPIGYHSHKAEGNGDIGFDYTSFDLDLLFGVRLWSHA